MDVDILHLINLSDNCELNKNYNKRLAPVILKSWINVFFFKSFTFYSYKSAIFSGNIYKRNANIDDAKEWKVSRVLPSDMDRGKQRASGIVISEKWTQICNRNKHKH